MTLRTRRILYVSFAAAFFLASPPLVLYTAGFRYDFAYRRIVVTGSLVVKSNPPDATVRLNGELRKEPTPTIINTILPGKIKLLVEKEGYHSWEKEIEIKPRVTSFEESITLFADAAPEAALGRPAVQYWWSPSGDKVAYATNENTLRLFNALNQKDTLIANVSDGRAVSLSWSSEQDRFFFSRGAPGGQKEFIVVETLSPERIVPLEDIADGPIRNVQWDPANQSSVYALSGSGKLIRLNYLLATEHAVAEGPIRDYLAEPKRIVMLATQTSGKAYLAWINPVDSSTVHLVPAAELSATDKLVATRSRYIAVKNPRTAALLVVDPSVGAALSGEAVTVIPEALNPLWTDDGNTLVYSDGFGIYTRSFAIPLSVLPSQNLASTLVTRYSKPIRELAITGNGTHVFYAVRGELRASELNASSDPRGTTLLSVPAEEAGGVSGISGLRYDGRRNALTFIGAHGVLQTLRLSLEDSRAFPFGN